MSNEEILGKQRVLETLKTQYDLLWQLERDAIELEEQAGFAKKDEEPYWECQRMDLMDRAEPLFKATKLTVSILQEMAGLRVNLRDFLRQFELQSSGESAGCFELARTAEGDEYISNPVLELLRRQAGILLELAGTLSADSIALTELDRFEGLLRKTAKVLHDAGVVPAKENDINVEMNKFLNNVYRDFVQTPTIPKGIKDFKPDGGVKSLKAAIEYKFVRNSTELKKAYSGILEDLSGYAGSSDWVHFYSVIYQTQPFAVEAEIEKAIGATGNAANWRTILVTGPGK